MTITGAAAPFIGAVGFFATGVHTVQRFKGCFGHETFASEELPDVVAQQEHHGCPLIMKDVAAAAGGRLCGAGNAEVGDLAQCKVEEEIVNKFIGKQVTDLLSDQRLRA
jgi:hypothetical protein